jgi:hypothetical protein
LSIFFAPPDLLLTDVFRDFVSFFIELLLRFLAFFIGVALTGLFCGFLADFFEEFLAIGYSNFGSGFLKNTAFKAI